MYTFSPDEVSENQNNEVVSSEISSSKSNENLFVTEKNYNVEIYNDCLLYTSPSPRDQ